MSFSSIPLSWNFKHSVVVLHTCFASLHCNNIRKLARSDIMSSLHFVFEIPYERILFFTITPAEQERQSIPPACDAQSHIIAYSLDSLTMKVHDSFKLSLLMKVLL